MNKEIEMPEPPEGYKWIKKGEYSYNSARELNVTYQLAENQTHRPDDTPLEIDPLPEMPDNVDRVEYFGRGLKTDDMGDADAYIFYVDSGWIGIDSAKAGRSHKTPEGSSRRYARVWYKKPEPAKTKLSDLIGEDGQKNAYLHWDDGSWDVFRPACPSDNTNPDWELNDAAHNLKTTGAFIGDTIKWSRSPFTSYDDALEGDEDE